MKKHLLFVCSLAVLMIGFQVQAQDSYMQPSKAMTDLVDGARTPSVTFSPDYNVMLMLEQPGLPSIEEVSQPELRLAGVRINPRTNGPSRSRNLTGITIRDMDTGNDRPLKGLPEKPLISDVNWSPDGSAIAFLLTRTNGIELWVADIQSAEARKLTAASVNDTYGSAYEWSRDGKSLLVKMVPAGRGEAPSGMETPSGPVIEQSAGTARPARTYQDLLQNPKDEETFEYYFTSELYEVDLKGKTTKISNAGIYRSFDFSPDGKHILIEKIHRPYSYRVPVYRFPNRVYVANRKGKEEYLVADLPLLDQIPIGFSSTSEGPRSVNWRADDPATLVWVEALDGGDQSVEVDKRDRVLMLKAPFQKDPSTIAELGYRYSGIWWTEEGYAMVNEYWRSKRNARVWKIDPDGNNETELIFDLNTEDRYNDPGSPEFKRSEYGTYVVHTMDNGNKILMTGQGASDEGNRPFLSSYDIRSGQSEILWRSEAPYYEYVVSVMDGNGSKLITRKESVTEQPNYWMRDLNDDSAEQITFFDHPTPDLKDVTKELITYTREDGVELSAKLYLPPGYDKERDGPLPTLVWAYPREFKSAAAAGQVSDSPYEFARIGYWGPHFMLTEGYAVVEDAKMPIIGEGDEQPNDTFVEQLVSSGQAIVDELEKRGITDPDKVAIGGHSYGAFMTANLLAHSDIFRTGIARSGAYNRTLTPFGFQAEPRTFWEAPEIYFSMSPFMHADDINEPILFIHGEADNNSGTFPMQSKRMYAAVSGLGGTARLVMLPNESHGYSARESVLHMLWEQTEWLNAFVRDAEPRTIENADQSGR
ncbi:S9 family peptidase [Balneola sp. MJW-20]|uniref:S9 family peptidase n=1 Tax=Gracilimonas aurantiaca TaxID=3234185 RepID=UPI0034672933